MKLSASLVAVKKIESKTQRSDFSDSDLDEAAKCVLQAEGIINPIILRRSSLESYDVLAGDFEYYVAARAREIDPKKGEMVAAFIVEPEKQEAIEKQIEIFRRKKTSIAHPPHPLDGEDSRFERLETRQTNFETRFENRIRELSQEQARTLQSIKQEMEALKSQIPERIEPLVAFNKLSTQKLIDKFKTVGLVGKRANQIVKDIDSERQKKEFESLRDVVSRIKNLSPERMLDICETW
jgi:secreted Zn-dependent insulinase-like peptidase